MNRRCVTTHTLKIAKLKGVSGLQEVHLDQNPITGIFGPNGVGKSTILYALAAAYVAPKGAASHDFASFFPRLADDVWDGSNFEIEHTIKTAASEGKETTQYRKGTVTTRWTPTCSKRPTREVCFIGLRSVVPSIERHSTHRLSVVTEKRLTDATALAALQAASVIMNIDYDCLAEITSTAHPKRDYLAIGRTDFGTQLLVDVTLGAGEQRLLDLLLAVHRTGHYSLILIDELDLLLHGDALHKLLQHLYDHCRSKHKQVIFTSHREEILKWEKIVSIHHLHQASGSHICLPNSDPDAVRRLTGERVRPLEIFVEDILAETIVNYVAAGLGVLRSVNVIKFGAATNCYTVAAGLLLAGQDCSHSLFVQDGDLYRSEEQKNTMIDAKCSGRDERAQLTREMMIGLIVDLNLPENTSPERYLHKLVSELDASALSQREKEIQSLASEIVVPNNTHDFVDAVSKALGGEPAVQLDHIVQLASRHDEWENYVESVRGWLTAKKSELGL